MEVKIQGTLHVIGSVEEVGQKNVKKRSFVVLETETYRGKTTNHFHPIELVFDENVKKLDGLSVGQEVIVEAELSGTEWTPEGQTTPKYFSRITAWNVTPAAAQPAQPAAAAPTPPAANSDASPF